MDVQNLYLESYLTENDATKDKLLSQILDDREGRTVIYAATENSADYVRDLLRQRGLSAHVYHGRMRAKAREAALRAFSGESQGILIASGGLPAEVAALPVRLVVHYNYPASMPEYIDQVKIAGGDGFAARGVLLYLRKDKRTQKRNHEETRQVVVYAQSAMCRTKLLSRYTSSPVLADRCDRCDNCLRLPKRIPVPVSHRPSRPDLDAIFEASL